MYRVLIVEDEELLRKGLIFSYNWTQNDCVVIGEASHGKQGLSLIEKLKPDIVLADVNMPIMNGLDMLKRALETQTFAAIILSGYDEFRLAKNAIRLGVIDYMLKPVEFDQLSDALDRCKEKLEILQLTKEVAQQNPLSEPIRHLEAIIRAERPTPLVREIIQYIEKYYSKKIGLSQIAAHLGYSPGYITKMLKLNTGYNFNRFLNTYRIHKAIGMLMEGNYKIRDIACQVGFSDYKYFHSVFKKYAKYPPSTYMDHLDRRGH